MLLGRTGRGRSVEVSLICGIADLFAVLDPFVARGQRVDPPVNEQAEAIMGEPARIRRAGIRKTGHRDPPL